MQRAHYQVLHMDEPHWHKRSSYLLIGQNDVQQNLTTKNVYLLGARSKNGLVLFLNARRLRGIDDVSKIKFEKERLIAQKLKTIPYDLFVIGGGSYGYSSSNEGRLHFGSETQVETPSLEMLTNFESLIMAYGNENMATGLRGLFFRQTRWKQTPAGIVYSKEVWSGDYVRKYHSLEPDMEKVGTQPVLNP